MKKALLFMFALLFATTMTAQNRTMFLTESFDGDALPNGWSIDNHADNWSVSNTAYAGGSANEMKLGWNPQFDGITRLVSPTVDLTGINSVNFAFKHVLENYSGTNTIGIATTSDGGLTWNEAWSQGYADSWVPCSVSEEISTPDMGQPNVQFCIFFTGNSYNISGWYFDDIQVFTSTNLDLAVSELLVPDFTGDHTLTIGFKAINYGSTTVTSVEASYQIEGETPVTETFAANIPFFEEETFYFDVPALFLFGSRLLTVHLEAVNGGLDDDLENNTLSKQVSIALATAERTPMIEHFSSSTCHPCVGVNEQLLAFMNNNPGRFACTKYQANIPGLGDPYYTEEVGVRMQYYDIIGVPNCILDGENQGYECVTQTVFDEHAERTTYMDIRGSFTTEGNTIHVIADVMPYIDIEARVYVAVNEKVTYGNVGTNGETEFHHVFMKMLPDAEGTTILFRTVELERLQFDFDMSETHVEEMEDLEVSIWVERHESQEILNSRFAYEYSEHPYPVENLLLEEETGVYCYCFDATWDAPAQGNPIGYNVYLNNELVAENTTETYYSFEGDPNEFYVIEVVALYENGMKSVKAVSGLSSYSDYGLHAYGSNRVLLDENQPYADVAVTNLNHNTHNPIEIVSIEEVENPTGESYLSFSMDNELPYTLYYDENFEFRIEANYVPAAKSQAFTHVKVNGRWLFMVTIDGELLTVTEFPSTVKLYPNPANAQVRIEAETGIESVKIYNMQGALVKTISTNGNTVNVNLSQYSNGVYLFSIRQSDGVVSHQRVVVSH